MASLESLLTRQYAAQSMSGRTVDDNSIAFEIVHTSTDVVTSVTVVSGTGITLIDAAGTSGSLAFNTYTTLGTLVDKINTLANWKARILDGLRATSTASSVLIPNSAVTAVTIGGESVYQVFLDQSVANDVFYRVSLDRGVLNTEEGVLKTSVPKGSHRVKITGITYRENISGATLNGVRIYSFNQGSLLETQIWGTTSVDDTATTIDFTKNPITSGEWEDLIVRVTDSAISDAITNFLQVDYIRE
jgi:hypothetical protein